MAISPEISQSIFRPEPEVDDTSVDSVSTQVGTFPTTGLDYSRDIAPLQRRFFQNVTGNRSIRPEVAARMANQFAASTNQIAADRMKIAEAEQGLAARKLQYESTLFALDREREKVNRERSMMRDLAPIQQQLDSIISDTTTTAEEKTYRLGQFGVKNSGLLTMNQAAANAYNAARTAVVKPKDSYTLADTLRSGGDPTALRKWAKDSKANLDSPVPTDVVMKSIEDANEKRTLDAVRKLDEARKFEQQTKAVSDFKSQIGSVKLEESLGEWKLSPSDRSFLVKTAPTLGIKNADKLSDAELHSSAKQAALTYGQAATKDYWK